MTLSYNRRWDDALAAMRSAWSIQPGFGIGDYDDFLFMKGHLDEQIAYTKELIIRNTRSHKDAVERLALFDRGLAEGGFHGAWRVLADYRAAQYMKNEWTMSPVKISQRYRWAGDRDKAVEWLWKAYEDNDPLMPYVGGPQWYDSLHSHPRYQELLRKLNLPVEVKK